MIGPVGLIWPINILWFRLPNMRFVSLKLIFALLLTTLVTPAFTPVQAQNSAADVIMVLPFENISNRPEYNWVGESFADSLTELLNKPGIVVVSGDQRELAYQQLRLPETVIPTRATAIKLARQAKASIVTQRQLHRLHISLKSLLRNLSGFLNYLVL